MNRLQTELRNVIGSDHARRFWDLNYVLGQEGPVDVRGAGDTRGLYRRKKLRDLPATVQVTQCPGDKIRLKIMRRVEQSVRRSNDRFAIVQGIPGDTDSRCKVITISSNRACAYLQFITQADVHCQCR